MLAPTRRSVLAASAGFLAAPALARPAYELDLPGHVKGPIVLLDYDQDELGVAYNQEFYSRTPMR